MWTPNTHYRLTYAFIGISFRSSAGERPLGWLGISVAFNVLEGMSAGGVLFHGSLLRQPKLPSRGVRRWSTRSTHVRALAHVST